MQNTFYPHVTEKTGRSEKPIDLPSRLLQDRIVYLGSGIDSDVANVIIMQLLWLNADDPEKPIDLYINSPGGSVYDGLAIKDVIDAIDAPVNTIGIGICMSMGAYLLASGTGERKAMKNCRVMIHSVSGGTSSNYHDMKIDFKEAEYLQNKLMEEMAVNTKGKSSLEEIEKLSERDKFMSPQEAIELGLIDKVI